MPYEHSGHGHEGDASLPIVSWVDTVDAALRSASDSDWMLVRPGGGAEEPPTGIVAKELLTDATPESPIADVLARSQESVYVVRSVEVPTDQPIVEAGRLWRDMAESHGALAAVRGWPTDPKYPPPPVPSREPIIERPRPGKGDT